jgi:aryl-alcohol dehydrogenase-like predicted oxidoreductase
VEHRVLGKTGYRVSAIGFGAWAIGADWGRVSDEDALASLHRALDLGVDFFDTADVYGDGRSERLIARLRRERGEPFVVATKAGRRLAPHVASGYVHDNLAAFVERSLVNLETDALDLLQLHCPPSEVYGMPDAFDALDRLVCAGKVKRYGVSVERIDEAMRAIERPGVASVQIVFNLFRQRPKELFFAEAARREVGILARLPLSSGMLTGKLTSETAFEAGDHRAYNRNGEAFDKGETFSGVDYALGLSTVEALRALVPPGMTMAQLALRWILSFPEVSCVIPGAKTPPQVEENASAARLDPLAPELLDALSRLYDERLRPHVHDLW